MDLKSIDWQGLIRNPVVLAAAGGVLVLVVVIVLIAKKGGGRRKTRLVDDTKARARGRIKNDFTMFRNDVNKAKSVAAPVFRKIDTESAQAQAIGHWRRQMNHRIAIRSPDLNALKGVARALGHDSGPISDLEAAWRKFDRQVQDYNSGKMDADKTPIATIRAFEKEFDKVALLITMCITKYAG